MPIKVTDDDGKEIEAFTAADLEAAKKEIMESHGKTLAEKEAEIANLKKVSAEKTENFKKYNDLTEAEKKSFDANTIELMKRNDMTQKQVEELTMKLAEKEKNERDSNKTTILKGLHKDDEKTKKAVEDAYNALSGMPESNQVEIAARASAAAKLAGVQMDPRNPLYSSFSGEAPKSKDEGKDFVDTEKGQEALKIAESALGIKHEEKK